MRKSLSQTRSNFATTTAPLVVVLLFIVVVFIVNDDDADYNHVEDAMMMMMMTTIMDNVIIEFWRMCPPFYGTNCNIRRRPLEFDSVLCSGFLVTDYHCVRDENNKINYKH